MATLYFDTTGLGQNWGDNLWSTTPQFAGVHAPPTSADDALMDANASGTTTINVSAVCRSLDCTTGGGLGAIDGSGTITIGGASNPISHWFDIGGIIWTATGAVTFAPNGANREVTTNGNNIYSPTLNPSSGIGGILLKDGLTAIGVFTITKGVLNTFSYPVSCSALSSANANTRTLNLTNSTVTLTGTGTVWDTSTTTGLTLTVTGSTIVLSDTSSTGKTFAGGSKTFAALTINTGTGTVTVTGNNTFTALTCGAPLTLTGTTQTTTSCSFTGCTAITGGTLSQASGTVTAPSGCTITNNTASGGATFDATAATDGGGNSGWTFGSPPALAKPSNCTISVGVGL